MSRNKSHRNPSIERRRNKQRNQKLLLAFTLVVCLLVQLFPVSLRTKDKESQNAENYHERHDSPSIEESQNQRWDKGSVIAICALIVAILAWLFPSPLTAKGKEPQNVPTKIVQIVQKEGNYCEHHGLTIIIIQ